MGPNRRQSSSTCATTARTFLSFAASSAWAACIGVDLLGGFGFGCLGFGGAFAASTCPFACVAALASDSLCWLPAEGPSASSSS